MSIAKCFFGLCLSLVVVSMPSPSDAQAASARGMGSVFWEGWRLDSEERRVAIEDAKVAAIEGYLAETSPQLVRLFSRRREEMLREIDRYVLATTVLEETTDKKSKRYAVVIRAELNSALLQADLDGQAGTAAGNAGAPPLMALVFMARSQDSVKSFKDRVYDRSTQETSGRLSSRSDRTVNEGERIGPASIEVRDSSESRSASDASATVTRTTGGSTLRKSDVVEWKVTTTSEAVARMAGVLALGGYEIVEAEYIESESGGALDVERIRKDFSVGDDLSPATMRSTVADVRAAGIPLLAIGTMDVGVRDTDPSTGNVRVFVTVTGRVLDVSGRFPKTVSSVGPTQFAGLGPSETVARNNALSLAAEQTAKTMADEMNLRGVR